MPPSLTPQYRPSTPTVTTTAEAQQPLRPRTVLRLRGDSQSHETTPSSDTDTSSSLRSEPHQSSRRVRWDENVINNEGMGKKSSKVCCIYHRPRALGESSDESSSSSSSDESDSDDDYDNHNRQRASRRECGHGHGHEHDNEHEGHTHTHKHKKPSPNAYERVPKVKKRHGDGDAGTRISR